MHLIPSKNMEDYQHIVSCNVHTCNDLLATLTCAKCPPLWVLSAVCDFAVGFFSNLLTLHL